MALELAHRRGRGGSAGPASVHEDEDGAQPLACSRLSAGRSAFMDGAEAAEHKQQLRLRAIVGMAGNILECVPIVVSADAR
eukprot:scaffold403022_cov48-Prasinocladus_malaysianus.AAC.1